MNLLLIGLVGLGAYLLFSSTPAAAAPPLPPGMTPRAVPLPPPAQPAQLPTAPVTYDPSTDPGPTNPTGGVVLDPNLGGVPDMSSQLPGLQPWQSVVNAPSTTASGPWGGDPRLVDPVFGYDALAGRWR